MANQSVVIYEKPLQHLGLADWYSRLTQLKNVCETRTNDAFLLRQSSRNLRNETLIQTNWDTYHNNSRLSDRIAELDRWLETMVSCITRLDKEISLLKVEKAMTEDVLNNMLTPLTVVTDCLTMRDCRLGSELTYDDGDTELKKELCIIENNQKLLWDQCQLAWEKLNNLNDVKFKLQLEIDNKNEAKKIDINQLNLDKFCANITFKPDAIRIPKNSCTYEGWLQYTKQLKLLADNELEDTYAMRESLFVSREKAMNILNAQQDRTEHTIRKRIFETQRSRNELEWNLLKIKNEMEKCINEINVLEQSVCDKRDALKLAETRLENRAQRSGMELCTDEAYKGLCSEVIQLRQALKTLTDKINCSKTTYCALEEHAIKIETDLGNKQHSLMTDMRGLDLRTRLKTGGPCSGKSQTNRNIELTKMEKEIPKE